MAPILLRQLCMAGAFTGRRVRWRIAATRRPVRRFIPSGCRARQRVPAGAAEGLAAGDRAAIASQAVLAGNEPAVGRAGIVSLAVQVDNAPEARVASEVEAPAADAVEVEAVDALAALTTLHRLPLADICLRFWARAR